MKIKYYKSQQYLPAMLIVDVWKWRFVIYVYTRVPRNFGV